MNKKFITKRDSIIVVSLIAICLILWLLTSGVFSKTGRVVHIYQDNDLIETVDLTVNKVISYQHLKLMVSENGEIAVIWADCADQVCVKMGKIKLIGQSIMCLPNHILVQVMGESDLDIVIK